MVLLILQRLQFVINSQELVIQFFSSKLNTRPYDRLDKKITDFTKCKEEPVVLHTTKCFHHQDGEDIDKDKEYKIHTQHQKQNKCCRTIACLLIYIQHKKKIGNQ